MDEEIFDEQVKKVVKGFLKFCDKESITNDITNLYHVILSQTAVVKEKDGSYSVTPCIQSFPYEEELCQYVKENILKNDYHEEIIPNKYILQFITEFLGEKSRANLEELKNSKINDYYGTVSYIKERTKTIIKAIDELLNDSHTTAEEKVEIESYQKDIEEISKSINSYKNTKESYLNDVSIPFARLLSYEKKLTKISSKRWHEFAKEKDAMLIHFLHPIHKLSDDMHRICASLYTKDLLNHVCSYLHIGYFYDFNFDNIVAIGSDDLGSWDVTKEEFLGQTKGWRKYGISPINTSWQWSNKNKCFFESGLHSTLYLPTTVEKEAIANDVSYTEIYLYNKDKPIKPIKCFYTEDATKEEINLITELAKEQNLPLEEIYIGNERKRKK